MKHKPRLALIVTRICQIINCFVIAEYALSFINTEDYLDIICAVSSGLPTFLILSFLQGIPLTIITEMSFMLFWILVITDNVGIFIIVVITILVLKYLFENIYYTECEEDK